MEASIAIAAMGHWTLPPVEQVRARSTIGALALTVALALCAGCTPGFAASAPVAPLLAERGDVAVGARVRGGGPKRGANLFVAAAPTRSTRVYGAVQWTRMHGRDYETDDQERLLKERNDTTQGELGAGWGTAVRHLRAELLAGLGYGKTSMASLDQPNAGEPQAPPGVWIDGRARLMRGFVQGQAAFHAKHYTAGGGLRLSEVHYQYDRLFGEPSQRGANLIAIEPFALQRIELWACSFDVMFDIPIVASATRVGLQTEDQTGAVHTRSSRLVSQPLPAIYLGITLDLDAIWRDAQGRGERPASTSGPLP